MSVLIKGIKKPENCEVCPYAFCHLDTNNCPLVEVPPHGRLVDIDKVYKVLSAQYHHTTEIQHMALREALSRVPTFVEEENE